jgi:GNAT superfamily N-acetyltransferase
MSEVKLRLAVDTDLDILWKFLAIAAQEADVEAARRIPVVAAHLVGWRRAGDFGLVAELGGIAIGAAWARQFEFAEGPTFWVDPFTAEVSIGTLERVRGRGVGTLLMTALVAEAGRRDVGLCLNVRTNNPAIRLYERFGFRTRQGSERANRAGGVSVGMQLLPGSQLRADFQQSMRTASSSGEL